MSTAWNLLAAFGIAIVIALTAISIHAQHQGNFCDWPTWTTPHQTSQAWGLCK